MKIMYRNEEKSTKTIGYIIIVVFQLTEMNIVIVN